MSVTIDESNLIFGEYEEESLFRIEKSSLIGSLGEGIRTVEFILRYKDDEILLVEAKSSSPKPGNQEDFDSFIDEIQEKFVHSTELYFSLVLKRLDDKEGEMPDFFRTVDYAKAKIKLLLVINGHKIEWLPPIANALREKLIRHIKTWRLEVAVINHEQAKSYGLLTDDHALKHTT